MDGFPACNLSLSWLCSQTLSESYKYSNIPLDGKPSNLPSSRRVTVWMWKVVLLSGEADGATPSSPCLNQYLFQMVSGNLFRPLLMYLVPYLSVSSWFIKQFNSHNTFHSIVDTKYKSSKLTKWSIFENKYENEIPMVIRQSPRTWGWGMMVDKLLGHIRLESR